LPKDWSYSNQYGVQCRIDADEYVRAKTPPLIPFKRG